MKRRTWGSTLIVAVLITVLIAALMLGMLEKGKENYKGSAHLVAAEQARAVAWAGLEDARLKLARDPKFPPRMTREQEEFTYSEPFYDLDGSPLGHYQVAVSVKWRRYPGVVRITSVGTIGLLDEPTAQVELSGDIDVLENRGVTPPAINPKLFEFINFKDSGAL